MKVGKKEDSVEKCVTMVIDDNFANLQTMLLPKYGDAFVKATIQKVKDALEIYKQVSIFLLFDFVVGVRAARPPLCTPTFLSLAVSVSGF